MARSAQPVTPVTLDKRRQAGAVHVHPEADRG